MRSRFRTGGLLTAADYLQAQRVRTWARREFADVMKTVDFLVTPTMTTPAPAFEGYDPTSTVRGRSFTAPFNVTGLPAISVPCGFTEAGLPVECRSQASPSTSRAASRWPIPTSNTPVGIRPDRTFRNV